MTARVEQIINGNTIVISPAWKLGEKTGKGIIIKGYEIRPAPGISKSNNPDGEDEKTRLNGMAVNRLNIMILNKFIEIREEDFSEKSIDENNRLRCPVYFGGVDVSDWFLYLAKTDTVKLFDNGEIK